MTWNCSAQPLRVLQAALAVLSASLLVACGGGGGGGASTTATAPGDTSAATGGSNAVTPADGLPLVQQDTVPAGGVATPDLFPMNVGDVTVSDVFDASGAVTGDQVSSTVLSLVNGLYTVRLSTGSGAVVQDILYWPTPTGLSTRLTLFADTPLAAQAIMGEMLVYPSVVYPVGAERQSIRQGTWGADLDGDGKNESFRMVFTQTWLPDESMAVPGSGGVGVPVHHLQSVLKHTLVLTGPGSAVSEAVVTEDTYVRNGLGPVLVKRSYQARNADAPSDGGQRLVSATIGGVAFNGVSANSSVAAPGVVP